MLKSAILVVCIVAISAVPFEHQPDKRQTVPAVSVRVVNDTSTGDGSQYYPFKITVREDAGTIFLFFEFEFTPTVPYINVRCQTSDGTATAYTDYYPIDANVTVHAYDPILYDGITIIDNHYHDYYYYKKYFFFHLTGEYYGVDLWIEICIDDDDYKIYGDPHFSVPLLHGGMLCYSIQGVPGLAFNLLSSRHLIINALFNHSVNDPTQATWIGKLAIIPQHTGNSQPIIFDSESQSIKIVDQGTFKSQFLQRVIINETGSIAVKATRGVNRQDGNPTVTVYLINPLASFDVTFYKDHLDVNWKIQTDEMDGSHGLLGQFMVNGVEVDSTKQMLIRPGFEPVPVEPSKNWDSPDNCWLAKNVGNQGEGLIDGSVFDYIVGSLESTNVLPNIKKNQQLN